MLEPINHPLIEWRGFILKQHAQGRAVAYLRRPLLADGPRINLTAKYKHGSVAYYQANIMLRGVDVTKLGRPGDSAVEVLNYCFDAISDTFHRLNNGEANAGDKAMQSVQEG